MRNRKIIVIIFMSFIFLFGCSKSKNSEFDEAAKEFSDLYFKLVENIVSYDVKEILILLHNEENQEILKELILMAEEISKDVPENREDNYLYVVKWINELKEINNEKYLDWQACSVEERRIAGVTTDIIRLRLKRQKD